LIELSRGLRDIIYIWSFLMIEYKADPLTELILLEEEIARQQEKCEEESKAKIKELEEFNKAGMDYIPTTNVSEAYLRDLITKKENLEIQLERNRRKKK
jgi:hypothetical protein